MFLHDLEVTLSRFRDFLYLDDRIVESLLSGIEGGHYESVDEKLTSSTGGGGKIEGGMSGVASAGINRDTARSSETQRVLLQNAEARFSRLWDEIAKDKDESVLECDTSAANPWADAEDSRFCKFVGNLAVPELVAGLAISAEVLQFGRMLEQAGILTPAANDMQNIERMSAMKDVIKESFPVVLRTHEDHPPVALPLDTEKSRVKIDRYVGRATVFGRIVERVTEQSSYQLVRVPGAQLAHMSRQQRRAAERSGTPTPSADFELAGPALVMRVIAIYQ